MMKKELELYVHIPFCVKKCAYCDFLSAPADKQARASYVDALVREIKMRSAACKDHTVSTVFVGGGTPSVLEEEEIQRLFNALYDHFDLSGAAEITLEANPGTVTAKKARMWKKCGVDRLSIGLQSVNDDELKMLGRIHTFREFLDTWETVRGAGFDNVNIDLISAIPGQTVKSWERTLRTAAKLGAEHLSAYSLIIEEGTPFYDWYGGVNGPGGTFPPLPDEDEERDIYRSTARILAEYGYHRYEISNYAKAGCECRHNLGYWERKEYLGLGLGASSLAGGRRFHNTSDMSRYMSVFGEESPQRLAASSMAGPVAEDAEILTAEDEMEEFMFLGLRKTEGVSEQEFYALSDRSMEDVYGSQLGKLEKQGLIRRISGRVMLTERGTDLSNYVMSEFVL